ncbi:MAG: DNA repair protein RecN [Gammaproteobacteria bacterium]|nr:DNA repair protein RecN [Gammaproteobacteria bacterium]
MLEQLSIKNLAVVEGLSIDFRDGMTVVTGETGAGKSIMVQALNLVIGGRSDASLVRQDKSKAEIIATFSLAQNTKLREFLTEQDLDDEGECILRRIVGNDGRSRAYVNGTPVTLSILRDVGCQLIDMHGQNEHQLLLRTQQHRILLDDFAETQAQVKALNSIVREYQQVSSEIERIQNGGELLAAQQELLEHQLSELAEARLDQEELDGIEEQYKISSNASLLIEKISVILGALDHEEGINSQLLDVDGQIGHAREVDERLESVEALLSSAQVQVQESIYELSDYLSKVGGDEESAAELEARINELHDLGRKHRCQIPDLLNTQNTIQKTLEGMDTSSEKVGALLQKQSELKLIYKNEAKSLSKKRQSASTKLSIQVSAVMQELGMPGSEIQFVLNPITDRVQLNGNEEAVIQVKTNMGQAFKVLHKVASGGELSRISLALSVVTSKSELAPSIVFDEVDVGISGAVAEVVGRLLRKLAKRYQVFCVTHLAQVAVQGHAHMRVVKSEKDGETFTQVQALDDRERTDEVARILGGIKVTEKTRIAAAEMIKTVA